MTVHKGAATLPAVTADAAGSSSSSSSSVLEAPKDDSSNPSQTVDNGEELKAENEKEDLQNDSR